MTIKSKIRTIPNYPKEGIMFRDITTLLKDPEGLKDVINALVDRYSNSEKYKFDLIVGIEARGFIIGSALAYAMEKGFIPIRKPGKLPAETVSVEYQLEYGTDTVEMHKDAVEKGQKVLLVDDLLATGGTALAAASLIEKVGGTVEEMSFIVDLPDIGGRKKIEEKGYNMFFLTEFEGD